MRRRRVMYSRKRVRLAIPLATLGAVSVLALAACGSSDDSSSGSGSTQGSASKPKQTVLIGASVWAHVPWLDSYGKSLQALGKKNGVDVNVLYSDANASTQTSQIEALLSKRPKAVIFTGIDPSADNAVLAKIKAAGIITVGGIIEPTKAGMDLVDAYRGPNDFTHGKLGAQAMAKALDGQCCEVAIVR